MKRKYVIYCIAILFFNVFDTISYAVPEVQFVNVTVVPDHKDWKYNVGEKVIFNISVTQSGYPMENVQLTYKICPEQMDIIKSEELILNNGTVSIDGGTMDAPGFLRCWASVVVNGKEYKSCGTAGFDVDKIKPTTSLPTDFDDFWESSKNEAAKIPMDAKMTLIPEYCTENVNAYHVSLQNYKKDSRIYGMLALPKKPGKYPALLRVPGAGVRAYQPDTETAEKGIITFTIGIHGIPVDMDDEVYYNLKQGGLYHYCFYNLDNKDTYYYKRVYLGCIRAIDYIFSLPGFDGENLAVTGGSQGGALSIVTAALDSRVKWLGAFFPALCDFTGYLHNRASGWPHAFDKYTKDVNVTDDKIETSKYYDVVNFSRYLKVPGYYSWGFNDVTCPPTSMYSAYNVIEAPKELHIVLETGHWTYPEQVEKMDNWLINQLTHTK